MGGWVDWEEESAAVRYRGFGIGFGCGWVGGWLPDVIGSKPTPGDEVTGSFILG